jgi:hypothetical protein
MSPLRNINKAQKEGRLLLAGQAYQKGQKSSIRSSAKSYSVLKDTLRHRLNGRVACVDTRANSHKLTSTEEEVLIQWILSIDERSYAPKPATVRNAAVLIL